MKYNKGDIIHNGYFTAIILGESPLKGRSYRIAVQYDEFTDKLGAKALDRTIYDVSDRAAEGFKFKKEVLYGKS
jgi:hypothetical protein